jgi:anaerobic selenocysteine-containing dehydrogenase
LVALAIGRLVAEARGGAIPETYLQVNVDEIARASGIESGDLLRLAGIFAQAAHPLAIPGGSTTGQSNGLEATQSVLALNALVGNLGIEGGLFLSPATMVKPDHPWLPNTVSEVRDLITRMQQGAVKVLFIHGVNPVFELPASLGFSEALTNVPRVISFASFPDETSQLADFILPDHTGLEAWGYQKLHSADRVVVSGSQPVVTPYYNTRASADVLLAAVQAIGGELAATLPYQDEVAYLQAALTDLVTQEGAFNAPEIRTFMAMFQQYGGWWNPAQALEIPAGENALNHIPPVNAASFDGEGEFYLFPYISPILGDGSGANKPWLQETPDPTTTVMWNSWVEVNPETAEELHLENDEVVKLITEAGEIEAVVYRYPAIRPDTVAMPFGQGHKAYGRYAEGRGANPGRLISLVMNGADELAFGATRVRIEKTGRMQQLSRFESLMGVYGEGLGE